MRSSSLVCAALITLGLGSFATGVRAAEPKAKGSKKPAAEADNINKTLQWEDKVMGPDDKRSELDKILKAQAINKAAQEKAERDREKAAKEQAAREAKEAAAPKNQKRGGEVALPSVPDEEPAGKKSSKSVDVSPKLDTAEAAAPPPPSKPADDKFIDKLLKEEGAGKKKKTASSDDKSLLDLLATDKTVTGKVAPKAKKKNDVDNLLLEADKEPAAAPVKVKHETPEWQKPEIQSTPVAAPVVLKPAPKRDDGIIHVVQGAAAPAQTTTVSAVTSHPAAPTRGVGSRKAASTLPASTHNAGWDDPFAADAAARKTAGSRSASRDSDEGGASGSRKAVAARRDADEDPFAPPPSRRNISAAPAGHSKDNNGWEDPFAAKRSGSKPEKSAASGRRVVTPPAKAAPAAHGAGWKDPFTDNGSAHSTHAAVAMRGGSSHKGWGTLKKHR